MEHKKKVLVIVAHPDDETIWMGGMLIRNNLLNERWDTTIITLCRRDDSDRAPKFKKVCDILHSKSCMSDLEDDDLNPATHEEIKSRIMKFADNKYDIIFTHGKHGEYGHQRHVEVHDAVKRMIDEKNIIAKEVFFFSYTVDEKNFSFDSSIASATKIADKFIKLNTIELLKKKDLIQNVYGFKKNSFEERCCKNLESFNKKEKTTI
ncbi:MAG: PIG-L family deacetylase [Candidatus Pacearchaeota archaeon]|jgi:LmbE family N-acetylglucosaminyl deacetylase